MPCSFGLLPHPRSEASGQPTGLPEVTVTDRCIPLVTATYGTRVARPASTTMLPLEGDRPQLAQRVRPVLGYNRLVGKPRMRCGSSGATSSLYATERLPANCQD